MFYRQVNIIEITWTSISPGFWTSGAFTSIYLRYDPRSSESKETPNFGWNKVIYAEFVELAFSTFVWICQDYGWEILYGDWI